MAAILDLIFFCSMLVRRFVSLWILRRKESFEILLLWMQRLYVWWMRRHPQERENFQWSPCKRCEKFPVLRCARLCSQSKLLYSTYRWNDVLLRKLQKVHLPAPFWNIKITTKFHLTRDLKTLSLKLISEFMKLRKTGLVWEVTKSLWRKEEWK